MEKSYNKEGLEIEKVKLEIALENKKTALEVNKKRVESLRDQILGTMAGIATIKGLINNLENPDETEEPEELPQKPKEGAKK